MLQEVCKNDGSNNRRVTSFWKTQLEAGNVMLGKLSNDEGKEVVELMMVLDITPV